MSTNPKQRRAARIASVQALYQMDVSQTTSKAVISEFQNHRFGYNDEVDMVEADEAFFEDIVKGVVRTQKDIDADIMSFLPEKWPLRRLNLTLRSLLRAGVYELTWRPDVPALVIIKEYVSIAADFFDGKEPGMVNGILDKVAKKARAAEFGLTGPATDMSSEEE